jgi:demethylmenaquinone methyltransferase/2-methoxy-6-polyprenyl-1,4-benzoquinol methylase
VSAVADADASASVGSESPGDLRKLFDENARTYDRVNTVISLGLDSRWREWVARRAVERPRVRVLDAFAGTGLVGLKAAALGAQVTLADISPGMLAVAADRARRLGLRIACVTTDLAGPTVSVPGAPFGAITMVFGVRYLSDPSAVMKRLSELLADGGAFVVMDFVEPNGGLISRLAGFYFFHILPYVAGLLAGRRELYRQLTATTRALHSRGHLEEIVRDAGLEIHEVGEMGFGLVVGIVGIKCR